MESGGFVFWPIKDQGDAGLVLHLIHGPPGKTERGSLAVDNATIAGEIETAAAGNSENGSNTSGASDGNVFAGRKNRGGRNDIRIVAAGFGGIDGGADRADFAEPHLRN